MMWWGYGAGPWTWLGPLMMIVFWALVIGGIALVLRAWWKPAPNPKDALSVLERRYASGEIDREEFQAKRDDLTGRPR